MITTADGVILVSSQGSFRAAAKKVLGERLMKTYLPNVEQLSQLFRTIGTIVLHLVDSQLPLALGTDCAKHPTAHSVSRSVSDTNGHPLLTLFLPRLYTRMITMQVRRFAPVVAFLLALFVAQLGWSFYQKAAVSQQMTQSASSLLGMLSDEQKAKAQHPLDSPQRMGWHFIPKDSRKGLQLNEMDDEQRQAAHALLKSALSDVGYEQGPKDYAAGESA